MLQAFGDGKIFGERYGEGPIRVVWLHGWARRGQDFARAAQILSSRGISSVALDLPGFGSSPALETVGGARHYAEALAPVIRALGEERVTLVGHSFGGRVATVVAAQYPELIDQLVLTGVPLLRLVAARKPPRRYRVVRWLHGRGLISDERMEAARQEFGSYDYRHATGVIRDVLVITVTESYEEELSRLSRPLLMVWGSDDQEVGIEVATRALDLTSAPHRLEVLEGVGHLVPTSAPDQLAAAVMEVVST